MVSLQYATLTQIADELERRAMGYRNIVRLAASLAPAQIYDPDIPDCLDEMAKNLIEMEDSPDE